MRAYERFLKYINTDSQSSETSGCHPSTDGQQAMADVLVRELKSTGIEDVQRDDKCYIYASVPASAGREKEKAIGLISHMDTSPSFSGRNIKPHIIEKYDGNDIVLNEKMNIVMDTETFPHLKKYAGCDLIVTDGTTLLGADDKAGVAEIITAVSKIINEKIPHPEIKISFTPDEEIGEGADNFDVKAFGADYAYTVDGGELGELQYENFNAGLRQLLPFFN